LTVLEQNHLKFVDIHLKIMQNFGKKEVIRKKYLNIFVARQFSSSNFSIKTRS